MATITDLTQTPATGDIMAAAWGQSVNAALRGPVWYNVRGYGAAGDGTTDDTAAIQSAINACGAAGGGVVFFPEGRYRVATRTGSGGIYWCLSISHDNVVLAGAGWGSVIVCEPADDAHLFFISGAAKASRVATGSVNSWYQYWVWEYGSTQYTTQYNLATGTSYAKGNRVLSLATAAEAGNFAAGDWLAFRTGNIGSSGVGTPDGEILRVDSVDAGAGTITLEHGVKCAYAREYFVSGTSGVTSTGVTANPAPYAVAKVTDRLLHNVAIRDLAIEQTKADHVYVGEQTVNFHVERVHATCNGYGLENFGGASRFHTVRDSHVRVYGTVYNWWLSADKGCSDFLWENVTLEADFTSALHINEGVARLTARGLRIFTPSGAGINSTLAGINGRGYDIDIDRCTFHGGGSGTTVYVNAGTLGAGVPSGRLRGCTFVNPTPATPFNTAATYAGWSARDYSRNDLPSRNAGATSVADGGTISHGLFTTPTRVTVTSRVAGEFVSVTARSSTTFTVAIKTHAGAAGTTGTVDWEAEV